MASCLFRDFTNITKALRKVIQLRYDLADIPPERFVYPKRGHGPAYCCAYLEARLKISSEGQGSLSIHFGRRELSIADINDDRRVVRVSFSTITLQLPLTAAIGRVDIMTEN